MVNKSTLTSCEMSIGEPRIEQRFDTCVGDSEPRVSVIVPAYNAADCLERAMNSALAQTMADLEVIVVDDASQDTTLGIARRVAARDSRVRVLRNALNSSVSERSNRAVNAAQGEWIAILDADDAWQPERLERTLIHGSDAEVVADVLRNLCRSYINPRKYVSFSLRRSKGLTLNQPSNLRLLDFVMYDLGVIKLIIRRSFLERHQISYNTTLHTSEDYYLYFEILAAGARWIQLLCAYYTYIGGRATQLTSDTRVLWTDIIGCSRLLLNHSAIARDSELATAVNRRIQAGQNALVIDNIKSMLPQHRFIELSRSILKQPATFWVFVSFVLNRFYLRGILSRRFSTGEYMVSGRI